MTVRYNSGSIFNGGEFARIAPFLGGWGHVSKGDLALSLSLNVEFFRS